MYYDKKVELYQFGVSDPDNPTDEFGIPIKTEDTLIGIYMMDVQPVTKRVVQYEFGVDEECQLRIWCKPELTITKSNYIHYKGYRYSVVEVLEWEDFKDFIVKRIGLVPEKVVEGEV